MSSQDQQALLALRAKLTGALSRIEIVRDLYLREGVTAAELVEAERLSARSSGIAYALSVVEQALEGQPA